MSIETYVATAGTLGAAIIAQVQADAGTAEALAKWPATLILAAVAVYAIYSMNKQAEINAKASEKQSEAIEGLVKELHEKPCIRNPKND